MWAGVHVLANGDQASLILFGLMGVLSLVWPANLDAKRRSTLGSEAFEQLKTDVADTAIFTAMIQTGPWRIGGGLALWAGLLSVHEWMVGAAPVIW